VILLVSNTFFLVDGHMALLDRSVWTISRPAPSFSVVHFSTSEVAGLGEIGEAELKLAKFRRRKPG
jgi:hypothetical protein